jgi:hypothetical protein
MQAYDKHEKTGEASPPGHNIRLEERNAMVPKLRLLR